METRVLHLIIAVVGFALVSAGAYSQNDNDRQPFDRQEFMTKRNAYITAAIGLTSEEAVKFISLENELKTKQFECGRECRKMNRDIRSQKLSNEIYLNLINCNIETRLKEAQLEKEYYEKFLQIISPEKLYKYQQAEFKFMREFMGNPGDQQQHRPPPPPRQPRQE